VERNIAKHVRLQRRDQAALNASARARMETRGLAFNEIETAAFRSQLSGVYAHWKNRLGSKCWSLLQAVGLH
jgi:TRAP-type C4-dicarboxylate transport system substrate-binding protein